jgi:penicillin amidase
LPSEDLHLLQQYAEGVNQFIQSHESRLPVEFYFLRYKPSPWVPGDTLVLNLWLGKLLSSSWKTDLMRELLFKKLEPKLASALLVERSPQDVLLIGTDNSEPPRVPSTPIEAGARQSFSARLAVSEIRSLLTGNELVEQVAGSNNWAVSGQRTAGGKPILANDPHLPHSVPSIWYMAHLQVPNLFDVAGVTVPGAPLIILGHNENIAWGATNLTVDVQDLYVETVDPQKADRYLVNGQWKEMEVREERIAIKGRQPEILRVRQTRHGPVIQDLKDKVLALRWTLFQEHIALPIRPALNAASSWPEFVSAMESYSGPVQNFVYADRRGNIGFLNAGVVPIRASGDGTVPVPGDTDRYEWAGQIPSAELPHLLNPESGLIVTANNRLVGSSYPYFLTRNWVSPHRARRIEQLLDTRAKLEASDMLRIQNDVFLSIQGLISRSILQAIERNSKTTANSVQQWQQLVDQLNKSDFQARVESVGTSICEAFREVFLEEILKAKLGEDWGVYQWANRSTVVENILRDKDPAFLPAGFPSYESFILDCLGKTVERLKSRFRSSEPKRWAWGNYLPLEFKHPLAAFWPLTWLFNTGPYAQPGAPLAVRQTTANHGVSMRMVVDFSDMDHSFTNITLGQSGQPLSPHYRDQFEKWMDGQSCAIPFSQSKIRQEASATLRLMPE